MLIQWSTTVIAITKQGFKDHFHVRGSVVEGVHAVAFDNQFTTEVRTRQVISDNIDLCFGHKLYQFYNLYNIQTYIYSDTE